MTIELAPPLFELVTSIDVDPTRSGFDVRSFTATEALSTLFQVKVSAYHLEASIDFEEIVGAPASFRITAQAADGVATTRTWTGIVSQMEQTRALGAKRQCSSYEIALVPSLWLLTQRRNYRTFQFKSELQIAIELLREWDIKFEARLDAKAYRARKYKVQYGETDYEFFYRILAEEGISFYFELVGGETVVVLNDAPHRKERLPIPLPYEDTTNQSDGKSYVTALHRAQRVRPVSILLRDRDYRKDSKYEVQAGARAVDDDKRDLALYDKRMELFYYPENFNYVDDGETADNATPYADSRGLSRTDEKEAKRLALIDLRSRRNDASVIEFETNDVRFTHALVFAVTGHPVDEINHEKGFLVVESRIAGRVDSVVTVYCEAVSARWDFRPTLAPKPRIIGLESATVVGAAGEEIDCDEFGRVKVHFHWDRYSKRNEESSCWIPVSQTWGGAGMGGVQIPRIGQEVLVEFLAGDPDRPIVTGRVFTAVNKVPLKLPGCKTQTILQSASTGGGGGHNMLRMEDAAGQEHLDMRAQKNMNLLVLNNRNSTIKGGETRHVDRCRIKTVGQTDSLTAGADILLSAGANLLGVATKNIGWGAGEDAVITAKRVGIDGKDGVGVASENGIILDVGGVASITICKFGIVIDGPKVLINPGAPQKEAFLKDGTTPDQYAEQVRQAEIKQKQEEYDRKRGEYLDKQETELSKTGDKLGIVDQTEKDNRTKDAINENPDFTQAQKNQLKRQNEAFGQ